MCVYIYACIYYIGTWSIRVLASCYRPRVSCRGCGLFTLRPKLTKYLYPVRAVNYLCAHSSFAAVAVLILVSRFTAGIQLQSNSRTQLDGSSSLPLTCLTCFFSVSKRLRRC